MACKSQEPPELWQLEQLMKNHVDIIRHWWQLGKVLLDQDVQKLDKIDDSDDNEACCLEMFRVWLNRQRNASWSELIAALKEVELIATAEAVGEQLRLERSMTLSAKDAIKRFEACLQKRLPLEDDSFFAMIKRAGLFPQYSHRHVAARPTRAEKVSYFLQNVVESRADEYLPKLLGVMKKSENRDVVNLAYEIQETMGSATSSEKGSSVNSRPTIKEIQRFDIIPAMTPKWYELGIELLDEDHLSQMDAIKSNHANDLNRCCTAMLAYWLQEDSNATWYRLVLALRELRMWYVAARIEALFSVSSESTSPSTSLQSEIFNTKPEMFDLMKIVIPKIAIYWEYIAYALQYDISVVRGIRGKADPKQCCQELFENWLSTSNGARPKVWLTLLNALSEVDDLSGITEDIIAEVTQLGLSNIYQDAKKSLPCSLMQFEAPDKVEECPSMDELDQYIVPEYFAHWRALGILLDVHSAKLDAIGQENTDNQKCCEVLLKEWLKPDDNPSWRKLLDAVKLLPVNSSS